MRFSLKIRTALWIAGSALLHLLLSLTLELSADEAHYALYALHPDWSYFDHPPLVAWVQWPFLVLGGSDLALRCIPMACWLGSSALLMVLSNQLYPRYADQGGVRADLLLFSLSPLLHLLGIALVPDTLLMPLTLAVMLSTWHLCSESNAQRLGPWIVLGVLLGLTGLAKYTAFLNAVGVLLVLVQRYRWRLVITPGPWLAVVIAAALVSPVFIWNSQHQWISFAYQFNHAAGAHLWRVDLALRFWAVIWLAFGLALPVLLLHAGYARADLVRHAHFAGPSPTRFSLYFILPGFMLWLFLSGRGSTLPHWVTPSVMASLPLAAAGAAKLWSERSRWPRWLSGTLLLQGVLLLLTTLALIAGGVHTEEGADRVSPAGQKSASPNPIADLYGWRAGAERAAQLAQQESVPTLAVANWTLASRIAWYARPMPVKILENKVSQFDLWFGRPVVGERMIVIDWSQMSRPAPVGPTQFKQCKDLDTLAVTHLGRQLSHFHYWLCEDWQAHP